MQPSETQVLEMRVRAALSQHPVTTRVMFGGTTFLLNGNMLCCVSRKGLMVRVGAAAETAALESPYAMPCLGAGRRMTGFIMVNLEGLTERSDLDRWLLLARNYVVTLPTNAGKKRGVRAPKN